MKNIISIFLRAITLFSKFYLIIILAKLIPQEDVGIYGLISGAIGYVIFVIGFEFYTYSTREMINSPKDKWMKIIKDQSLFYCFIYFSFIPVLILMYKYEILPKGSELWFVLLLICEHLAQEINRILISDQKHLLASIVLFIRQGAWCWVAIAIMAIIPDTRNVETVFIGWLIGTFIACIIGLVYLKRFPSNHEKYKINWQWIKKGALLSLPMLIGSLAIRGIFTFDRFAIGKIAGLEILGAYVLFASMVSAIQSFLDSIVISFAFPKLTELVGKNKYGEFINEMVKFSFRTIIVTFILCIACWMSGHIVLQWLSKISYLNSYDLFISLIVATFVYCMSLIPHLGLYALRKDKIIVLSQVFSFIIFLIFLSLAFIKNNIIIIPIAMIVCFLILLIFKGVAFFKQVKLLQRL
ncbi:oligosaccharide flippase family protein [Xenorhabdus doucetiae]|uniref:oligosaccharide flippase family protein n=1 Tax=Xenorhabdus doucetiae TaxID=351671 RepID=UPI002B406BB6|nr:MULTISPECIES: oligosaccharide flippase family protein [unclassified Xenorhabdus]